ncbi:PREDICTED: nucleolar GTP-binding protein 1-like [Camelina sativa]|uniref:Nucleolar GTP-binding protein 1-like n=1 Tax=Camelina sativa TaxID=90675 RepID=A0ABM0XRB5_CAMSA|nr:PREDICTED: nucleolar GTP-binding protein 1-like [Camelina sativa]
MEVKNSFKKISVVPNENDFDDAIVSLIQNQITTVIPKNHPFYTIHDFYTHELWVAQMKFSAMFAAVSKEFPPFNFMYPSFSYLLCGRYNDHDYLLAQGQVQHARALIIQIGRVFKQLMNQDDCDSLDKYKRLKVSALGCLHTVAMRCMPSLAFLEKVRQHMTSLPESNLEEYAIAASSTTTKFDAILALEDCAFPLTLDVHTVADFVRPQVLSWLYELERGHGPRYRDDPVVFAEQYDNHKEHHLAAVTSMKSLVI